MAEKSGLHPAGVGFADCGVFDHLQPEFSSSSPEVSKKKNMHTMQLCKTLLMQTESQFPCQRAAENINIAERKEFYPKCVQHSVKNDPKVRNEVFFSPPALLCLFFSSSLWCWCLLCRGWAYLQDLAAVRGAVDVLAGLVHAQRHAVEQDHHDANPLEPRADRNWG